MPRLTFEWDASKDAENYKKPGIAFVVAQLAFADPRRVIAKDLSHSTQENRFYCFGRVGDGILTVRFTYRGDVIRIYGATGGKEGESMSGRIRYTDEPLGSLKVVDDFLPRPEDLVFREEGVKVTISLSKRSVKFFKNEARKHKTQYQRMIRHLLDAYVDRHSPRPTHAREKPSRTGYRARG